MALHQTAITDGLTPHARYLTFRLRPDSDPREALRELARNQPPDCVVGIGHNVISVIGASIAGLRELPVLSNQGIVIPSTPGGLWIWLRGTDRGELLIEGQRVAETLRDAFALDDATEGFMFDGGRDLGGYEDGTENPVGDAALDAAIVQDQGAGRDGGSFVAVQRWVHDLARFRGLDTATRDDIFGRRIVDNEEFDEAPASAHVKRTAQESFDPPAFVLRRSMSWSDPRGDGLVFVAFGNSLNAFDTLLRQMVGLNDGITDGLFRFTRPVTGSTFWCPPLMSGGDNGHLDLSAIGL